jgi:hypothetical protein
MFLYTHLTPPTLWLLQPHSTTIKNRAVSFLFRVPILFDFVFPFPSTKKKNISCLFATPHSPSHTQEMKRKVIKKIFDRVRVVSICVHHVDPTHPSPAEKKGKKKVVGLM